MYTRTIKIVVESENKDNVDSVVSALEDAVGNEVYEMRQCFPDVSIDDWTN